MKSRFTGVWALAGLVLSACVTDQQEAPVVAGYQKPVYRAADMTVSPSSSRLTDRVSARAAGSSSGASSSTVSVVREAPMAPLASTYELTPVVKEEHVMPASSSASSPSVSASSSPVPHRGMIGLLTSSAKVGGDGRYAVQPGDTVYKIARAFNTNPKALLDANSMASTADLQVGSSLIIPASSGSPAMMAAARAEQAVAAVEPAAGPKVSAKADVASVAGGGVNYAQHTVVAGETIYRIATQYHSSVLDIMAANDFDKPQDLKLGSVIKVPLKASAPVVAKPAVVSSEKSVAVVASTKPAPDATVEEVPVAKPVKKADTTLAAEAKADELRGKIDSVAARTPGMAWPAKGPIIHAFGDGGHGVSYTGISIKLPENTQVVAVEPGKVLYAGEGLKTYGNLVLLRHNNGMVTAYAHNNALLVKKGEVVRKGQVLALSGATGNVDEPQLHFEIRKNAQAVDPMALLPREQTAGR